MTSEASPKQTKNETPNKTPSCFICGNGTPTIEHRSIIGAECRPPCEGDWQTEIIPIEATSEACCAAFVNN